ncbi:hypothetical protein TI05_14120, partial [Achromatium sp. WMS3]
MNAVNEQGIFAVSKRLMEVKQQFAKNYKLIKKDPDDPDIMDALLAENQKLFNQMSDLLEKQLKEGSGLIRRGQILRLLTDRTVCDQPMVSLM